MRIFLILLFSFLLNTFSQSATIIKVNNAEYAGKKLNFYTYADPVTMEKIFIFSLELDKNGQCSVTLNTAPNQFVFSEFGIYKGLLILEANKTIEIKIPPLREKSFADEKNPYFEAVSFWFSTSDKTQLNSQISSYSIQLNQLINKYFDRLYFRQSREIYDSILYFIDKDFSVIKSEAFQFHQKFTLKLIEAEAFREKPEEYSEFFSRVPKEFWTYPAFIDLFEKTFHNQLSFEAKSLKGDEIRNAVNRSNLDFLLSFVNSKYMITGENAQIVLLKLLHDAWYSRDFSEPAILKMINADVFLKSPNDLIRTTAKNINHKITFLQPGTDAPAICLNDLSGNKICSNQKQDKFKYLVFADLEMIVCKEHLKYLSAIQERFSKYLEIYIIIRETEVSSAKQFFAENEVPGFKLMDEDNKFIELYRVKSFPQCFLLDQKHQVQFDTAKAPLDGFEQQFGAFMQREMIERQRNQSR